MAQHPHSQAAGIGWGMLPAETHTQQTDHKAEPTEQLVCPFCGESRDESAMCPSCGGRTDPLSRQATQNEMGPWFVRDEAQPFRPGCRIETMERWVRTGRVQADSVIRGPSTHQNWVLATRAPGVARLFGLCHSCGESVGQEEVLCRSCGTLLTIERDRQHLGLSPVRPLPGQGTPNETAQSLLTAEPVVQAARHVPVRPAANPAPAVPSRAVNVSRDPIFERRLARAKQRGLIAWGIAVLAIAVAAGAMYKDEIRGFISPTEPAAQSDVGDSPESESADTQIDEQPIP